MRRMKAAIFGILAALLALLLVGCQALPEERAAAVLLVGHHDHSKQPQFDAVMGELKDIYHSMGCASVVLVDEEPSVYRYEEKDVKLGHEEEIPTLKNKYQNDPLDKGFTNRVNRQIKTLERILATKGCTADDPQVDTLKALETAVAELNSIISAYDMDKETTKREILVCDTGLCTTGKLDFHQPEWNELLFCEKWTAEQDERLEKLVKDLECSLVQEELLAGEEQPQESGSETQESGSETQESGGETQESSKPQENAEKKQKPVVVIWYGLGETDEELPYSVKDNLKTIWTAVLKAAGAENPQFEDGNWGRWDPEADFEEVTPIKIPEPSTETRPEVKLPETNKILFTPGVNDTNEFAYPDDAMETLREWTEYLKTHDKKIVLVGTTTTEDGTRPGRSEARIKMVEETWRKLLEDQGLEVQLFDKWKACSNGIGYDTRLCREEDDEFFEENRAVWIFLLDSKEGQEFRIDP